MFQQVHSEGTGRWLMIGTCLKDVLAQYRLLVSTESWTTPGNGNGVVLEHLLDEGVFRDIPMFNQETFGALAGPGRSAMFELGSS
jgi:hypothetical protein